MGKNVPSDQQMKFNSLVWILKMWAQCMQITDFNLLDNHGSSLAGRRIFDDLATGFLANVERISRASFKLQDIFSQFSAGDYTVSIAHQSRPLPTFRAAQNMSHLKEEHRDALFYFLIISEPAAIPKHSRKSQQKRMNLIVPKKQIYHLVRMEFCF